MLLGLDGISYFEGLHPRQHDEMHFYAGTRADGSIPRCAQRVLKLDAPFVGFFRAMIHAADGSSGLSD